MILSKRSSPNINIKRSSALGSLPMTIPEHAENLSTGMLLRSAVHCCSSSSLLPTAPSLPISSSFSLPSSSMPSKSISELFPSLSAVSSSSDMLKIALYSLKLTSQGSTRSPFSHLSCYQFGVDQAKSCH